MTTAPITQDAYRAARSAWLWARSGLLAQTFSGVQTFTASGATSHAAGSVGSGVDLEGGASNLVVNPSFETSTTGWLGESGGSIARISSDGKLGSCCLQVTCASNGDGAYFRASGDAAVGVTYAQSIWLKAAGAGDVGKSVQGFVRGLGGTFEIPATNSLTLSASWQRLTFAGAWAHGGHTGWDLVVRCVGTASSFLLDAAQYEEGAYATPYCDGSLGDGYTWTGTAHASSSVREASRLTASPSPAPTTHGDLPPVFIPSGALEFRP